MKPNILYIFSDQHNAQCLGSAGHPVVKTPQLDRMASEGIRFNNAICQNAICTPSRISYLSGQYCHNHLRFGNSGQSLGELPNLFGHLRRFGYQTASVGKNHCPEFWVEDQTDLFLEVYDACSIGGAPEYNAYLKEKGLFDVRDDGYYPEQKPGQMNVDGRASNMPYEDSVEGWTVRRTIEFMEQSQRDDKPFFAFASLPRPHSAYCPSEPFWSMYDEADLQLPPNTDYDMALKAPTLREERAMYERGDWTVFEPRTYEEARYRKLHGYYGCVSQVDHAAGELIDWIDQAGLGENTIIIYSSDHGDFVCQHGLMEKAPGICSDAITRVPMIWRWTGHLETGHTCEALVESVDVTATLCKLIGVDPMITSDGLDISTLLSGGNEPVREIAVTESAWSRSVRKGKYRFVYYPPEQFEAEFPDGFGELYDIEADPWEMDNLYFKEEHRERIDEMTRELLSWLVRTTRTGAALPMKREGAVSGWQTRKHFGQAVALDGKISTREFNKLKNRNYL